MSFIHLFIGESFQKDQINLSHAIMLLDISPKEAALTNEDSKKRQTHLNNSVLECLVTLIWSTVGLNGV